MSVLLQVKTGGSRKTSPACKSDREARYHQYDIEPSESAGEVNESITLFGAD